MSKTKSILRVSSLSHVPGHCMWGDSALPGREYSYVSLKDLLPVLLPGRELRRVKLRHIWAQPGGAFGRNDFVGPRFESADPKFPGLLVRGMPNPQSTRYRLIDGRRRLEKLRRKGAISSLYYVFEISEIQPFIYDFELIR
jgi:hypothetical protein